MLNGFQNKASWQSQALMLFPPNDLSFGAAGIVDFWSDEEGVKRLFECCFS